MEDEIVQVDFVYPIDIRLLFWLLFRSHPDPHIESSFDTLVLTGDFIEKFNPRPSGWVS